MTETPTQQQFLRAAKITLGFTWPKFAERIGAPETTVKKWVASENAKENFREMPSTIWVLVREVMAHEALKADYEQLIKK